MGITWSHLGILLQIDVLYVIHRIVVEAKRNLLVFLAYVGVTVLYVCLLACFCCCFETGSLCIYLAILELTL